MPDHTPNEPSWERVEEVFYAACDIDDAGDRAAYVREACAGDEELRAEVERLLEVRDGDSQFLEPPPLVAADLAGRVIDDFEVVEEIGRGGMGVVYRAKQRSLGREVALKVLPLVLRGNDAVSERFRREAIAASKLRHPGIATVLAFGEIDGTFYYAMELVEGTSLRDAMDRAFRGEPVEGDPDLMDPKVCADLVRQMAEALHFAHEAGVIHRDVKPHNILIERDGRPRLIDFGLAKLLDLRGVTLTGDVNGTPHYMSPEQADATRRSVDRRTDVYSLGAVLYELLAKRTPFLGASSYEVLYRITHDEPRPLRKVAADAPRDLEVLCARALEREPDDRLASAAVLAAELARFVAGESIHAAPRSVAQRAQRRVHRSRRGIQVALVTAALVTLLAFALWPDPKPSATFTVRFLGDEGVSTQVDVLQIPFEGRRAETLQSFEFVGEASIELPTGIHRVLASDGEVEWDHKAYSETGGDLQVISFLDDARLPDDELVIVPSQTVRSWRTYFSPNAEPPQDSAEVVETASFRVAPDLLTFAQALEAIGAIEGAAAAAEFRAWLLAKFEGAEDFDEDRFFDLPATYLDFDRAQNCLSYFGLRLPTMAEAVALVRGGEDWLVGGIVDPDATPLRLGSIEVEGVLRGLREYYRFGGAVGEGRPLGPLGLRYPLGNVSIWTSTPVEYRNVDGDVVGLGEPVSYGVSWFGGVSSLTFEEPHLVGVGDRGRGYVTTGVRGVRDL
ncbi:Serine/threonine-protein kinase PknB [Planctomycetes bacterium Pla163]|uniref:Serine/threonine-protein kinase PknB n=1 Tax=Rohdeia mirabilis TaxID=2528008 RepID=A0A518CVM3_9BACT|nr:Serine/threonine-protein kinase PknB [Planctomycetes bacterium Pla163]